MIIFVGTTGVGKSTSARLFLDSCAGSKLVKAATPIYEAQQFVYDSLEISLDPQQQDPELLRAIAATIVREKPGHLANRFLQSVNSAMSGGARHVVCDDLRDNALSKELLDMDPVFVQVQGPLRVRPEDRSSGSPTEVDKPPSISPDFTILNDGDIASLTVEVQRLVDHVQ